MPLVPRHLSRPLLLRSSLTLITALPDVFASRPLLKVLLHSVNDLLAPVLMLLLSPSIKELIELSLIHLSIPLALLDLFLELVDLLEVLPLLLMSLGLLVSLDGLVEFLVL